MDWLEGLCRKYPLSVYGSLYLSFALSSRQCQLLPNNTYTGMALLERSVVCTCLLCTYTRGGVPASPGRNVSMSMDKGKSPVSLLDVVLQSSASDIWDLSPR